MSLRPGFDEVGVPSRSKLHQALYASRRIAVSCLPTPLPNVLLEPTRDIDLQIRPLDGIERRLTAQFRYRSVWQLQVRASQSDYTPLCWAV